MRTTHYGGGHQARSERDAFATLEDRLAQLNAVDGGSCSAAWTPRKTNGTTWAGSVWPARTTASSCWTGAPVRRAPSPGHGREPHGPWCRRRLVVDRRDVTALEDDVFDAERVTTGVVHRGGRADRRAELRARRGR
ncbi:hypothetical protein QJS66_06205 [Kocuria rhizophila]|nr:hypothetical protein QJS66_06205 [Kocuria rhizophila]